MTAVRPLRADAARNQVAVLDAARAVLAEYGTDASMELIASRAGVGVGTVYRHFPNKEALIDALVKAKMDYLIQSAAALVSIGDGRGLASFLFDLGQSMVDYRGFARSLVGDAHADSQADELRRLLTSLVSQARTSGELGSWVTLGDVMSLIWALRGLIESTGQVAPAGWQRYLDLHLAALRIATPVTRKRTLTADQLAEIAALRR